MSKGIPGAYRQFLETQSRTLFVGTGPLKPTLRGFWVGCFLSFFLAIGAPYGNMIIKGSYMALDISTPGAIFLFLFLIGVLNLLLKLAGRNKGAALVFALLAGAGWLGAHWPLTDLDPYSPGLIFSSSVLLCTLVNLPLTSRGRSLALNRSELILVYAMLLIVSALCTMGLSEELLPALTAIFYFASPENKWRETLFPHFPAKPILVDDGNRNTTFYEGVFKADQGIPYGAWAEPLMWWSIFLLALYLTMVSTAVILRRQWMERERLAYPLAQVGLAMIRGEDEDRLVNGFFKQKSMWLGFALPLIVGSLTGLSRYNTAVPVPTTSWWVDLVGQQQLHLNISFAMIGFSYLINTRISASIWVFQLLSHLEKELFIVTGLKSDQQMTYGIASFPFLGYQGLGALLAMVLVGLWTAREHLKKVVLKALGQAPHVDDGDEIMSYRHAVIGVVGGILTMAGWLWIMGTPFWVGLLCIALAMLIFIGMTRVIVEAGVATLRSPMVAPDFILYGLGSSLAGPSGSFNLCLTYIWNAEVRSFVMATCANALKLVDEMEPRHRRTIFRAIVLALLIGALGSFWMIFHMAYQHGGINLSHWFFNRAPLEIYENAARNLEPTGPSWPGIGIFVGGGAAMLAMMWACQHLTWWPLHPIGFPICGTWLMRMIAFSVFLAWFIKVVILRYGGPGLYRRSQPFFLGMIAGQMLCNGMWLVIDYFTGKIGNSIFYL